MVPADQWLEEKGLVALTEYPMFYNGLSKSSILTKIVHRFLFSNFVLSLRKGNYGYGFLGKHKLTSGMVTSLPRYRARPVTFVRPEITLVETCHCWTRSPFAWRCFTNLLTNSNSLHPSLHLIIDDHSMELTCDSLRKRQMNV